MNIRNQKKFAIFIQTQSKIRIVIDDAGNYGNQAANYNLIVKLRQLGFKGEIDVIYFKDAKDKILKLFNFPAQKSDSFYSKENAIHFIELSQFLQNSLENSIETVRLGLSGAIDKLPTEWQMDIQDPNFANVFHVESFVRFSPYYYSDDNLCDTEIYLRNAKSPIIQKDSCKKMLLTPVSSFAEAKIYLQTKEGKTLLQEYPALENVMTSIENESIYFQPLYGWTLRESPSNLLNIILGSRYAQLHGDVKKPLVMGAFFDLHTFNEYMKKNKVTVKNSKMLEFLISRDDWNFFSSYPGAEQVKQSIKELKLHKHFHIADIDDFNTIEKMQQLHSDDVLLLIFPPLPKVIFDGIYTYHKNNIFPPVREGASSLTSLLSVTGKPHIHCRSSLDWEIKLNLADDELQQKLINLNNLVCREVLGREMDFSAWQKQRVDKMIGEYILEAQNPHSALSHYFARLKVDALSLDNDRIQIDLETAINLIEKQAQSSVVLFYQKVCQVAVQGYEKICQLVNQTNILQNKADQCFLIEEASTAYILDELMHCKRSLYDKLLNHAVLYAREVVTECPSYFPKDYPQYWQSHQPTFFVTIPNIIAMNFRAIAPPPIIPMLKG